MRAAAPGACHLQHLDDPARRAAELRRRSRTSSTRRATCGCSRWSATRPCWPTSSPAPTSGSARPWCSATDAPGFIANRLGAMWIDVAIAEAIARGLDVELADAAIARAFGSPKTGVFGLLDLVGIDLSLDVTRSLNDRLAADDPLQAVDRPWDLMEALVASGRTGPQGRGRLLPAGARPLQARARPRHRRVPARAALPRRRARRRRLRRRRACAHAGLRRAASWTRCRATPAPSTWRWRPATPGGRARSRCSASGRCGRARPGAQRLADLKQDRRPVRGNAVGVGLGHRRGRRSASSSTRR